MADERRNVIEVLTRDHREVQDMFGELSAATDPAERRRIADDVTIELVRHSIAEEAHLYPAVREHLPGGGQIADKELADHAEIERVLKELEQSDPANEAFTTLVRRLVQDVTAHVQDDNLFPKLAAHTTTEQLLELGDKVESAKRMAPTRPHPAAPDKPPLNKLLAPGVGLIDRVRDHLTGRGR
jgi:hemerythrin superfamily protein